MDTVTETELIACCRKGESAAWEELFRRHYAAAGRFIFQLASDFTREDAQEICQETFVLVIRHLGSFEGHCQFQTWLFRLAANKARDYREKQRASKRGGGQALISLDQPADRDLPPPDPPSEGPPPDECLMRREQAALISQALGDVGPPCREMIELRYFGELSYEEIATAMRLNPKTVSSRLSRCLDRLEAVVNKARASRLKHETGFEATRQ